MRGRRLDKSSSQIKQPQTGCDRRDVGKYPDKIPQLDSTLMFYGAAAPILVCFRSHSHATVHYVRNVNSCHCNCRSNNNDRACIMLVATCGVCEGRVDVVAGETFKLERLRERLSWPVNKFLGSEKSINPNLLRWPIKVHNRVN